MDTESLAAHIQAYNRKDRPLNWKHHLPHRTPVYIGSPSLEHPDPSGVQWGYARGKATTHNNLRVHSVHLHVHYTIVIMEEGNLPHPRCPACDLFVPWEALNLRHPATALCSRVEDRKRRRLVEEEAREGAVVAFWDYNRTLKTVLSFKYLWRLLTSTYEKFPSIIADIWKSRKSWSCMDRILVQ